VEELQAQDPMIISVFAYREADGHGWPAADDQRFIRFLQDGGVTVAFRHDDESGLYYVVIRGRDVPRASELKQRAKAQGVPVPSMVPTTPERADSAAPAR
jgi:hypothetical protein